MFHSYEGQYSRKLTDLLPESTRDVIVWDIFGTQQGTIYIKGLLDAAGHSEFDQHLLSQKEKWDELEYSINPHKDPQFTTSFSRM